MQDLRYALRQMRGNPWFTTVTVLVLALTLGANAAVFSVVNAVLLRPLPFPDADRVVQIWETNLSRGQAEQVVSPYNFLDWQRQSSTLSDMAVYEWESPALITHGAPARLDACFVSGPFFRVYQAQPLLGRTFRADEDRSGERVVVLSYSAWRHYFSGDPKILGRPITLDREPYTVIGVMPDWFRFPAYGTDLWATPAFELKSESRGSHHLYGVGRIKRGATLSQAQAEMTTIAHRLERQYPDSNQGYGVKLVRLQDEMTGNFRRGLLLLWGAVALVLLIGCANVAHLLLARGVTRQKEFAIRSAVGANRPRLIRQLLTESAILAIAGGLLGLALSLAGVRLLTAGAGRIMPRNEAIHVDARVVIFTAIASLVTAVLFGLAPAFRASRVDLATAVKQSGWESATGGSWRLRSVLVISELALSVMLLIGAGLLMKTVWQLRRVDPGFQAANVLGMRISVAWSQYPEERQRAVLYQQIIDRVRALPGVEDAAATNDLPFSGSRTSSNFDIEGVTFPPRESPLADYRTVSSGYFNVMRIPLLKGRVFSEADNRRPTPLVAIINETLAHRYWPHSNPVGQHIVVHDRRCEIVGVVGNVLHQELTTAGPAEIYVPQYQGGTPDWSFFAVRSRTSLVSLVPAVRNAFREAAPQSPLYDVRTMEARLANSIAPQQFSAFALTAFALFALPLATIGIYGVVAFAVERRTQEMGIRMAVGAQPGDVLRLIVRQGLALGIVGVVIGVAGALAVTRVLASMLYGAKATDPATYLAISGLFLLIAALASYVPARRASRVDPMTALRWE
ncbi:MAG TPA: ABC transporter permease [Bryobacteraceae bacterium]|nr:ABC transporter permease [Bryobacteraceae bacterium]